MPKLMALCKLNKLKKRLIEVVTYKKNKLDDGLSLLYQSVLQQLQPLPMVNLCLSASGLSSHQQIPQEIVQQHCPKSKCQYKESKHLSDSIRMTKTTGSSTWAILKCTKQHEHLPKLAPLNSVEVWLLLPPIKGTPMI